MCNSLQARKTWVAPLERGRTPPTCPRRSTGTVADRLCLGGLALLVAALLLQVPADPDLWGHLRFGLEHVRTGQLATSDPYSYTAGDHPWVNHEWLSEWILGRSYMAWGDQGLLILRAALMLTSLICMGRVFARRHVSVTAAVAWGMFAIPVLAEFFRLRPQMFTYALMSLLLLICDTYRPGRARVLCWIPLLIATWANLHAGFVAGLGVLGIVAASWCWRARGRSDRVMVWRHWCLVLAASVAGTLLNPYGLRYWEFVWYAVRLERPHVTEWRPMVGQHFLIVATYVAAVVIPAAAWLGSCRRHGWYELLLFGLAVALAGRHARHFPFLLLFGSILFARHWPRVARRWWSQVRRGHMAPRWCCLVLVAAAVGAGGLARLVSVVSSLRSAGPIAVSPEKYPVAAVDFLMAQGLTGNLDCGFTWGEYCLFRLFPQCRVFCDGRYETAYPPQISDLALYAGNDPNVWRQRLDDFGTDLVLLPVEDPFAKFVASRTDFREIFRDNTARILIRCPRPVPAAKMPT